MDTNFVYFSKTLASHSSATQVLEQLNKNHVLNSNLILYALWYGQSQQGRLRKRDIHQLIHSICPWHERILLALQRLNNNPHLPHTIVAAIKKEVLIAEQIERELISDALFKFSPHKRNSVQQLNDACHNIALYCKALNISIDNNDQYAFIALLQTAFPHLVPADIAEICTTTLQENHANTQLSLENV